MRQQLWATVKTLNAQGVTILLTTHYLEEAQQLCDRIAIINHGQVVACEETPKLLAHIDNKEILFRLDRDLSEVPGSLSGYATEIRNHRVLAIRYSPVEEKVGAMIEKFLRRDTESRIFRPKKAILRMCSCSLRPLSKE